MELSVLVQHTAGNGFRAWCGEPIPASAEGATREEALARLRATLEGKVQGVEVVRLTIPTLGQVAEPTGTTGDEQLDDPEVVARWVAAFDAIPPLQMTTEEETAWKIARLSQRVADRFSVDRIVAQLPGNTG
ncbi:MAG: hypothetical protein C0467_06730 [Planctomycetaceae bacterium]|nr:hypothetical protein [Planctomycetaceae bacterium]